MKDQKGYEHIDRPFDWQDRLVLWACAIAVAGVLVVNGVLS